MIPSDLLKPSDLNDFARRYTAAWCSQDPASVAAFYSIDGSLTINDGAPSAGRIAIGEAARSFMEAFPDLQVIMDNVLLQGQHVVYRWTLTGRNSGPGGSGHRVRISGFEEWILDGDGLIAKSQGHFDDADYRRQLDPGTRAANFSGNS